MPVIFDSNAESASVHRYLHSFCLNHDVAFEAKHKDERVRLFLRAHPITQIPWIIFSVLFSLTPLLLNILFGQFLQLKQLIFITIIFFMAIVSYVFINLLIWLYNIGLVTTERIIDVDFKNILYTELNTANLSKIEDITVKRGGFFGAIFHFGSVFIQTAGVEPNIEFINIPNPEEVASVISNIIDHGSK